MAHLGSQNSFTAALVRTVDDHLPISVLSTSWGACEIKGNRVSTIVALEQRLRALTAAGVTVTAASGDSGRYDCSNDAPGQVDNTDAVDFPASSPFVLSVGGTTHAVANPPVADTAYTDPYVTPTTTQKRSELNVTGLPAHDSTTTTTTKVATASADSIGPRWRRR